MWSWCTEYATEPGFDAVDSPPFVAQVELHLMVVHM